MSTNVIFNYKNIFYKLKFQTCSSKRKMYWYIVFSKCIEYNLYTSRAIFTIFSNFSTTRTMFHVIRHCQYQLIPVMLTGYTIKIFSEFYKTFVQFAF